jgi:hypothetical protein
VAARSSCSATPRRDSYERRRPDATLLYQLIEEHWPIFLDRAEQSGGLPDFIVEEFEAYLLKDISHVSVFGPSQITAQCFAGLLREGVGVSHHPAWLKGDAARTYFGALPSALSQDWRADLAGRSRRPPRDRVNAMLSFAYSLLTREAIAAIGRVGLDPMLGFFHSMIPAARRSPWI